MLNVHNSDPQQPGPSGIMPMINQNGHIGDNSIEPISVHEFQMNAAENVRQTVCNTIRACIQCRENTITITDVGSLLIAGKATMPAFGGDLRMQLYHTEFPRVLSADPPTLATTIHFGASKILDVMDIADAGPLVMNGCVNCKTVASHIRDVYRFGRALSENIASYFKDGLQRHDNSSIWVILTLMEVKLYSAQRMNNLPHVQAAPAAGGITLVNVAAPQAKEDAATAAVIDGICRNKIFLYYKAMTEADFRVIQALTVGVQAFEYGANVPSPHLRPFTTPGVQFVIWNDDPMDPLPVNHVVTADDVRSTARRMATLMNEKTAYVRGYTRGMTIANGMVIKEQIPGPIAQEPIYRQRYFTSGLETTTITLPRPMGHNFLWRVLNLEQPPESEANFNDEYNLLASEGCSMRQQIGAGVSALFSLGMSTALHVWNISGRELNNWAGYGTGLNNSSYPLINDLFHQAGNSPGTVISSIACGLAAQITSCAINPTCFPSADFCSDGANLGPLYHYTGWEHVWPHSIPYMARPESMSWMFNKWAHVWCITSPGVKFDFTRDIISAGPVNLQSIKFAAGESKYRDVAKSASPFVYVPYGQLALNVIRQHFRFAGHPLIEYQRIIAGNRNTAIEDGLIENVEHFQPKYENEVYQTVPGTMLTYDWHLNVVLAPQIGRKALGNGLWGVLSRSDKIDSALAGIFLDGHRDGVEIPMGIPDIMDLVRGFGPRGAVNIDAGAEAAPEN